MFFSNGTLVSHSNQAQCKTASCTMAGSDTIELVYNTKNNQLTCYNRTKNILS